MERRLFPNAALPRVMCCVVELRDSEDDCQDEALHGGVNYRYDLDDAGVAGGQMSLEFAKPIRWAPLVVVGLAVICATNPMAVAQHGTAEPGLYTLDYHGDTWTGTLTAVDHEKDAITLTYEHKGKSGNFTGLFKRPLELVDQNGQPTHAQTHLQLGDSLTVYYIPQGRKYSTTENDGKSHKHVASDNLIFKIMLLPPLKTKH